MADLDEKVSFPRHRLTTIDDLFRVATKENFQNLCQDMALALHVHLMDKNACCVLGRPCPASPEFLDWTDDGKIETHVTCRDGGKATLKYNKASAATSMWATNPATGNSEEIAGADQDGNLQFVTSQ